MDYWKLLTEGPLHASEEAAAADLKNDSKSKLVRYGLTVCVRRIFFVSTIFVLRRPALVYMFTIRLVVRCVRRLLAAAGAKIPSRTTINRTS